MRRILLLLLSLHAAAGAVSVEWSRDSQRGSPMQLSGTVEALQVYIFVPDDGDIKTVEFFLDKTVAGNTATHKEGKAPYDLAGTSGTTSLPLNTVNLPAGAHFVEVLVTRKNGATEEARGDFTIPAISNGAALLDVSATSDRMGGVPLDGRTIPHTEEMYIFIDGSSMGDRAVQFFMDRSSGVPDRTDTVTPFDYVGEETDGTAVKLNKNALGAGLHTLTAYVEGNGNQIQKVSAIFTIVASPNLPKLEFSPNPDRSASAPLEGATLTEATHIFIANDNGVTQVKFYLNTPSSGTAFHIEGGKPFDFGGTVSFSVDPTKPAIEWDLAEAAEGANTVIAVVTVSGTDIEIQASFTVNKPSSGKDCNTAVCADIKVTLPRTLSFDSDVGHIKDSNDLGTGFTYVLPHTPGLGNPYKPALLTMDTSAAELRVGTTNGIEYDSENDADNLLCCGVPAADGKVITSVWVDKPGTVSHGGKFEQAGVFFGNDQDNTAKLVWVSYKSGGAVTAGIMFNVEIDGSYIFNHRVPVTSAAGQSFHLRLEADPATKTILGEYSLDGMSYITVGSTVAPDKLFSLGTAVVNPAIGTATFAGITTTHRKNNSPLVFILKGFTLDSGAPTLELTPSIAAGYVASGGSETITIQVAYIDPLTDVEVSNVPVWATILPLSNITTPGSFDVTLDTAQVPAGTTVTATVTLSSDSTGLSVGLPLSLESVDVSALQLTIDPVRLDMIGKPDSGSTGSVITITTHPLVPTVTYSLSCDEPWLSWLIPGPAPGEVTVLADTNGLAEGSHSATCVMSAPNYVDITIPVKLVLGNSNCLPMVCSEIRVPVPHNITFTQDNGGSLLDKNGVGTGFTYVFPHSPGAGTSLDAYIKDNLEVDTANGELLVTTTKGIEYKTENNADNLLSFGFAAPNQMTYISTWLMRPYTANTNGKFEQAGVFFGHDQDNVAKVVWVSYMQGSKKIYAIMFLVEVEGVVVKNVKINVLNGPELSYELRILVDPYNQKIYGDYSLNGVLFYPLGVVSSIPSEFFSFDAAGIDPIIGTRSFGGIAASQRHGTIACKFRFKDFYLKVGERPLPDLEFDFTRKSFGVEYPTNMAFGPDGKLYVTSLFGQITVLTYDSNLNVVDSATYTTLPDELGPRLTLGIAIDPHSTVGDVILWVAHSSPELRAGGLNSGMVSKLSGSENGFPTMTHPLTGLPRAEANHGPNSLHFKDGKLYLVIGGNSGAGGAITIPTEFGKREEQFLAAAIVVADVFAPGFNGQCYANGEDPWGKITGCDVTNWATGLRNSYDFVFHTNGQVYATDNGLGSFHSGAYPVRPTPPCFGFASHAPYYDGGQNPLEQTDLLYNVKPGRYYGHGNPARDECVFKDGSYQGVPPDPRFDPPIGDLGMHASANGIIEYTGNGGCGNLAGDLLVLRYSSGDDILRVELSPDGLHAVKITTIAINFNDPLSIRQNTNGDIFVAEHGGKKVTAMRFKDNCTP
eukprot:TRINITY_DN1721_c0_g1_i3.p1 TRINITY_DN1721_c0_g1~~TRINITY_DN1721_c0_g1_i3.p1  ORF type:complete len:1477 (+),score=462.59 TRINITY_DN1721_c0_g1_i3:83-4513(+)